MTTVTFIEQKTEKNTARSTEITLLIIISGENGTSENKMIINTGQQTVNKILKNITDTLTFFLHLIPIIILYLKKL